MIYFFKYILLTGFLLMIQSHLFADKPRLVIGIMIDGLQKSHVEQLRTRFGQDGLRKICFGGAAINRVECNIVSAGNTSDITTLMTGTVPYYHGITGNSVFNRMNASTTPVFEDKNQSGIETNLKLSAFNMKTTSLLDELMFTYPDRSKSYVVAIQPEDAIAMGGHTADGVVWINDATQKWSTTTYYSKGLPWQAMDMNSNNSFVRHGGTVWTPLYNPDTYLSSPGRRSTRSFEYMPNDRKPGQTASWIRNTPAANALVSELALRIVNEEKLGTDIYPDLLMLQYTVRTPDEKKFSLQSMEKEDMYLRLDGEIQFLMQKIESWINPADVLFFVFGNQTNARSPEELKENNIYAGYFNAGRSLALLNSYLIAMYGQEKWVDGYHNKNIYLNKKKIEEKNLNMNDFLRNVASFMSEFEGIQSALTYRDILNQPVTLMNEQSRIRNSTYKNSAGDIVLTMMPGWIEVNDKGETVGESSSLVPEIPFYFYGWNIQTQTVFAPCSITDLAPTICNFLSVPAPNGNIGRAIEIQLK